MRQITTITDHYDFKELSDSAKNEALTALHDINVSGGYWFEHILEDTKTIGVELSEFDTGRASYCKLKVYNTSLTIAAILKNHGKDCNTYKLAYKYHIYLATRTISIESTFTSEFEKELAEEYLSILRREYDYLTSGAAIIETIEANEYTFTIDGKLL